MKSVKRLDATRGVPQIVENEDQDPAGNAYRHFIKRDAQFVAQRTLEELDCIGNYLEVDVLFGRAVAVDYETGTCELGRFTHNFKYRSGKIVVASLEASPEQEDLNDVYHSLFHEVAHAARYFSPSFTQHRKTTGQYLIDEGIAEVFAAERTDTPLLISDDVTVATNGLIEVIKSGDEIPREWLSRKNAVGPYIYGARIVLAAMDISGASVEDMIPLQYEEIFATLGKKR